MVFFRNVVTRYLGPMSQSREIVATGKPSRFQVNERKRSAGRLDGARYLDANDAVVRPPFRGISCSFMDARVHQ